MGRKIVGVTILAAFLVNIGCMSRRQIPVSDAAEIERVKNVRVTTNENEVFNLQNVKIDYSDLGQPKLIGYEGDMSWRESKKVELYLVNIKAIEVVYFDGTKTCLQVVGGGCLALAALTAIVAATKEYSCPFIYSFDGKDFVLEGELYSGAIFQQIERKDWLKLHSLSPVKDRVSIKISNEVREAQYTDELVLMVVDHVTSTEVFCDKEGGIHTVTDPQQPVMAFDFAGNDILTSVAAKDGNVWSSDPYSKDPDNVSDLRDGITMKFTKPPNAVSAKLVVRIGNTYWADFILGRWLAQFGYLMNNWYSEQARDPKVKEKAENYMKTQGLCLNVKLLQDIGWSDVDFFYPTGPIALQEEITVIPMEKVPGDTLTLRLEGGSLFWMVDRVGIDYSPDGPVHVEKMLPTDAIDQDNTDVRQLLTYPDDNYHIMPRHGLYAHVSYVIPPPTALSRSFFVQNEGYYSIHQPSDGMPDYQVLTEFQQDANGLLKFSLQEFRRLSNCQAGTSR